MITTRSKTPVCIADLDAGGLTVRIKQYVPPLRVLVDLWGKIGYPFELKMLNLGYARGVRLKGLQVALICWAELPLSALKERLQPLITKSLIHEGKCAYQAENPDMKSCIIPDSMVGLRFFCRVWFKEDTEMNAESAKRAYGQLEGFGIQSINDFFSHNLPNTPTWVYFYPIWYSLNVKPSYRKLLEIEKFLDQATDMLLTMELEELKGIYPLEVTTPEIAVETLPAKIRLFDPSLKREALVVVARGLSLVIGASEEFVRWFERVVLTRIEPRPYVSFGELVPRKAENIETFPFFYHVQLVSGKGWIDNMLVLEEALERYSMLAKFSESEERVKDDVLFAFCAILITVALGILTINFNTLLLAIALASTIDAILFAFPKIFERRFPVVSRKLLTGAKLLFYMLLPGFIFSMVLTIAF